MKNFKLWQQVYLANGLVGKYMGFIPEQDKHVVGIINHVEEEYPIDRIFYSFQLYSESEIYSDKNEVITIVDKEIKQTKEMLAEALEDLNEARDEHFRLQQEIVELRNTKTDLKKLIVNKGEL